MIMEEAMHVWAYRLCRTFLYLPLNFIVNLKLLKKIVFQNNITIIPLSYLKKKKARETFEVFFFS